MIEVIEARTVGKKGDPALNEDGFVVAGGIAAVVDGVTSKSTAGIWEPSGGVVARRALCAALERLGSDEPPCDPADMRAVQRVLDGELRARYEHDRAAAAAGGIAYFRTHPVDRAEANAVVYSHGAGRIWLFGDCQAMVNGQAVDTVKTVDRLLGALRSFVVQAHDLAAEDSTRQQTGDGAADPGRAAIMPFLRMQNRFANTRGEFGYFVFDGFTDPTYPIRTLEARPGDEVVLASDGYPDLRPTLVESQAALEQLRRTDPACSTCQAAPRASTRCAAPTTTAPTCAFACAERGAVGPRARRRAAAAVSPRHARLRDARPQNTIGRNQGSWLTSPTSGKRGSPPCSKNWNGEG